MSLELSVIFASGRAYIVRKPSAGPRYAHAGYVSPSKSSRIAGSRIYAAVRARYTCAREV